MNSWAPPVIAFAVVGAVFWASCVLPCTIQPEAGAAALLTPAACPKAAAGHDHDAAVRLRLAP